MRAPRGPAREVDHRWYDAGNDMSTLGIAGRDARGVLLVVFYDTRTVPDKGRRAVAPNKWKVHPHTFVQKWNRYEKFFRYISGVFSLRFADSGLSVWARGVVWRWFQQE